MGLSCRVRFQMLPKIALLFGVPGTFTVFEYEFFTAAGEVASSMDQL